MMLLVNVCVCGESKASKYEKECPEHVRLML